jgi:hypothetical protein
MPGWERPGPGWAVFAPCFMLLGFRYPTKTGIRFHPNNAGPGRLGPGSPVSKPHHGLQAASGPHRESRLNRSAGPGLAADSRAASAHACTLAHSHAQPADYYAVVCAVCGFRAVLTLSVLCNLWFCVRCCVYAAVRVLCYHADSVYPGTGPQDSTCRETPTDDLHNT